MDQAAQGKSALSSGDFTSAISQYTRALSSNPHSPDYYIQRSKAYTRLSPPNHLAALKDAEIAVVLANRRAKRELITSSQLRRAIALFGLERWADSKQCLQWVKKLDEKEKSVAIWESKVSAKLMGLSDGDERAKVTVKETPETEIPAPAAPITVSTPVSVPIPMPVSFPTSVPPSLQTVQTPAHKIRSDWYQSQDIVTVTLMAKGVPQDKAVVKIAENTLQISFPLPTGSEFDFALDPLYSTIDPDGSSFKIMSTKVEFRLKKAKPGLKWASLEGTMTKDDASAVRLGLESSTTELTNSGVEPLISSESDSSSRNMLHGEGLRIDNPTNSGPAYPTSSKSGPKNWDKLADDLMKRPKKKEGEEAEDEAADGPALDDEDGGDAVDGFFKKLFKDADPDTKRAMMKSYQESNGTALSTNWAEVGKKTVETSPPDGMEAKKWGA